MQKILVTGNAGSGKSSLSKVVAEKLNLPVYSLDKIVWKSGWEKASEEEKSSNIHALISKDNWVIDGVSMQVMKAADTIIFLDFPRRVCFYRAFKRNWKYLFKSRPELPDNCPEILIMKELIRIIWNFPISFRPKLIKALESYKDTKKIIHIRSNEELFKVEDIYCL